MFFYNKAPGLLKLVNYSDQLIHPVGSDVDFDFGL